MGARGVLGWDGDPGLSEGLGFMGAGEGPLAGTGIQGFRRAWGSWELERGIGWDGDPGLPEGLGFMGAGEGSLAGTGIQGFLRAWGSWEQERGPLLGRGSRAF
ncbi:hypothetical protein NDU88_000276 [Pleurodeles waltl]|uniref:Uncharacterized protein n=1 Tax=Pleurodeles waltl TaxID=8319 RepID=A0AAV7LXP6_PLEWA|nr:hypothetical protein NDU88_000271 [Pleurodeles waltl]KAJ1095104.1 hypothetical protein NDU88_000274 [Pleurodeles waltl]KAJ1095106.1 hypothetical protein NDU88_000276 [Pleurodeles waltl]